MCAARRRLLSGGQATAHGNKAKNVILLIGDGMGDSEVSSARYYRPGNEPSLSAMTRKAIELLQGDRDGFFLQVEGASIDKQDHAANACAQIGEMIEFDNAIAVAQAFARKNPDTRSPRTTGSCALRTGLQAVRRRRAAPPSQQHTGSVMPVFAQGPGASALLGTTDHTDLFGLLTGGDGHR